MEALVPSDVIIKDTLVSTDDFLSLTPTGILNEEELLNQEIKTQYKAHIKALQMILAIFAGIPLSRLEHFRHSLPPSQPWSVSKVGLPYFIIQHLMTMKYEQEQKIHQQLWQA